MDYVVGIVTYNPDLDRLSENIFRLVNQSMTIYLIDNSPGDNIQLINFIKQSDFKNLKFLSNFSNLGLSKALNQLCDLARNDRFSWLLMLDQDSLISENFIDNFCKFIDIPNAGMFCPIIVEDSPKINYDFSKSFESFSDDLFEVNAAITSGSYINLSAHEKVGGFFEEYFIDLIDFDYSKLLLHHGYKIYCVKSNYLLHQYGVSENTLLSRIHYKIFSRNNSILYRRNYPSIRIYYQFRNRVIFYRRWRKPNKLDIDSTVIFLKDLMINVLRQLVLERKRLISMIWIIKGVMDGFSIKVERASIK